MTEKQNKEMKVKIAKCLKKLRLDKSERENRKITQEEIADILSVKFSTYQSWEQNKSPNRPSLKNLIKIADMYCVSLDYLIGRSDFKYTTHSFRTDNGIEYEIKKAPKTEKERKSLNAFHRMINGEGTKKIMEYLGESKENLSKMLKDVIYGECVEIKEESLEYTRNIALEKELKEHFEVLQSARVFKLKDIDNHSIRIILLGIGAASFFKAKVKPAFNIGIANGYTVSRLVKTSNMKRGSIENISIFPLTLSNTIIDVDLSAASHVGYLVYNHQDYGVRGEIHKEIIPQRASTADVIVMGLGSIEKTNEYEGIMSKILRSEHVDLEELRNQGVVGDILYNLVMEDGSLYQKPQDFPTLPITSIDLDILKNLVDMQRLVIAIVSRLV